MAPGQLFLSLCTEGDAIWYGIIFGQLGSAVPAVFPPPPQLLASRV